MIIYAAREDSDTFLDDWNPKIRPTYNRDSILAIRLSLFCIVTAAVDNCFYVHACIHNNDVFVIYSVYTTRSIYMSLRPASLFC